jgi:predicted SpoU family rRNA methylase
MKKLPIYLMLLILSLSIIPTSAYAVVSHPSSITNNPKEVPAEVQVMLDRLNEIKKMDKSEMTRADKKELRKEVRAIKTTLKKTNNGVYLSVGAIIIIVLLLILI